jgi:hypothetical protein
VSKRLREHGIAVAAAAVGVWAMTYLALYGFGWNDYSSEVEPAYAALIGGHLWQFLTLAPGYGGSLELRAPFALLAALFGGGPDWVYRAVSIPCLVAAALLAIWLLARMRELGCSRLARATTVGLCIVNPVTLYTLQLGHPEELLGAVLCVAAVLAAQRGQATWSGVLLGLAVVNKEWALLAIGPVLLALPGQRRRALLTALAIAVVFYAPLLAPALVNHTPIASAGPVAGTTSGSIFQPWQLWWFLGAPHHLVTGSFGVVKVGYRKPPLWLETIPHPLIIALGVPATIAAWRRRADPLLLLAFLLAIRAALDPWDTVYYPLPFILALLSWESLSRRRPPVLALVASVVVWLVFIEAPGRLTPDQMAIAFAAVAVPTIVALGLGVYRPRLGIRTALQRSPRPSSAPSTAPISPL